MSVHLERGTMKHTQQQKGQALVLIVLGIVGMIALVALAIDGGNAFMNRRHAQAAADAAAMAAALAKLNGQNWQQAGLARAASNEFLNDGVHDTVTVVNPPGAGCKGVVGPYVGNNEYIQVIINSTVGTFFAQIVGVTQTSSCVESIARAKNSTYSSLYNGQSVVGLAPNVCDSLNFCGTSQLQLWGSGMFSNSSRDCGVDFSGSTQVKLYDGGIQMVANNYTVSGNPQIAVAGGITGGAAQQPYPPPAEMLPSISCSGAATQSGSTMNPGNWSGTFPPNGVDQLNAGTYCINGDFRLQGSGGTLTGNGVTIFMQTGGITWSGNAEVKLTPPATGPYAGLLIYAPPSNTSAMSLNGNSNSLLQGLIFMPGAAIDFNGTGQLQKSYVQLVGYTVNLCGTADTQIVYRDADNWDVPNPPTIDLVR
jgi:Flp pilus assembly protein TadG